MPLEAVGVKEWKHTCEDGKRKALKVRDEPVCRVCGESC